MLSSRHCLVCACSNYYPLPTEGRTRSWWLLINLLSRARRPHYAGPCPGAHLKRTNRGAPVEAHVACQTRVATNTHLRDHGRTTGTIPPIPLCPWRTICTHAPQHYHGTNTTTRAWYGATNGTMPAVTGLGWAGLYWAELE